MSCRGAGGGACWRAHTQPPVSNVWPRVTWPRPASGTIIRVQKKTETPLLQPFNLGGDRAGLGRWRSLFTAACVSIWAPGGHPPLLCSCSEWTDVHARCHLDASRWPGSLFAKLNVYLTRPEMTPVPGQAVTPRRRSVQLKD